MHEGGEIHCNAFGHVDNHICADFQLAGADRIEFLERHAAGRRRELRSRWDGAGPSRPTRGGSAGQAISTTDPISREACVRRLSRSQA